MILIGGNKKMSNKKGTIKLMAILAVVIIVLAALVIVFESQKEEQAEEKDEVKVIDDRINPYVYQGLTVEVLRMRYRGILDTIFNFGNSYKNIPEYYYVVEVDGEIGDSSEVEASGGNWGSGTFSEYDTMLKECRTNFRCPDGQEKSNVKITINEIQKSGLLGKKVNHVEKMSVDLIYDYRTGRWTGDDEFQDEDGMGHVLCEEYELWFNLYQSDYDHDYVPYWMEVNVYGMDPTDDDGYDDPDGDGIPSWWEYRWGYDPMTWDNHEELDPDIDGVENTEEYMMAKYFADPYHPDVYIEVDYMEKDPNKIFDFEHVLYEETKQMVIEKLSRLGISTYFDDGWSDGPVNGGGEYLEFVDTIDEIVGGHMARWWKHNFADERKGVFRYFQTANEAGVITPSEFNPYNHIVMTTSRHYWLTHFAFTERQRAVWLGRTVLHELGHTMGLVTGMHPGIDNMGGGNFQWPETLSQEEWENVNKNYVSIMNYYYGSPFKHGGIKGFFEYKDFYDFSDGTHGEGDFDDYSRLYLPTFQIDAAMLESPDIRNLGFEEIIWTDKDPEPVYSGWEYDENLTEEFENQLKDSNLRFDLDNAADYYYRIYVKTDENEQGRDLRIYVKPGVKPVPAHWELIAEGNIDEEKNTLDLYSREEQINHIYKLIEEENE